MNPTRHLLLAAPLTLCSTAVLAEAQTYDINIPAQPLPSALEALAQQTGIRPFYSDNLVAGKTARAVSGRLTVEQALSRLLSGSGLSHRFNGDKAVAITAAETDAKTLPPVKVSGQAEYDSTDPYNPNYNVPRASTATKTDTPIMETPASIQIVPKALMNDQQNINILDSLNRNVSGVSARTGAGLLYDNFIIRGFTTGSNGAAYRNGLLYPTNFYEPANIEQLEVMKGPAAALYGRVEPGGHINITTKKPQATPYYSLQQQFGSYDLYRTTVDATGPIDDDKTYHPKTGLNHEGLSLAKSGNSTHPSLVILPTVLI